MQTDTFLVRERFPAKSQSMVSMLLSCNSAAMTIEVGATIGDYRVEGELGRGGMGKVYRVRSLLTGREEAMKVVLPYREDNPEIAERFLREIRVHASLEHPNIAALHTAIRVEDRIVMILELVDGYTLEERLRHGPLDPPAAVALVCQVLDALEYAHARGVIHRDIKPANIMVTRDGRVKLTDFGVASASGEGRLTRTGYALGSLPYMSPEQVRSLPVDGRSDIYSLGVALYEIVVGSRPIQGDSEYAVMNAQLQQVPAAPADVSPSLPRPLSDAIMKALAKEPANRFQTAAEFRSALQASAAVSPGKAVVAPRRSTFAPEDLERAERRLSRYLGPIARRLVAGAAPRCATPEELYGTLAEEIENAADRAAFLKAGGGTTSSAARPTVTIAGGPAPTWPPDLLEKLAQSLALFLGPIAKVVVNRAAKAARSEDQLYSALAAEIPDEAGRKRFLAARAR